MGRSQALQEKRSMNRGPSACESLRLTDFKHPNLYDHRVRTLQPENDGPPESFPCKASLGKFQKKKKMIVSFPSAMAGTKRRDEFSPDSHK